MKIAIAAGLLLAMTGSTLAGDISFWDQQRKGTNFFSVEPLAERFQEAHDAGVSWGRLAYDKWAPTERDFLIGNADHYDGLVEQDAERLEEVLGWAADAEIGVVVTPLTLPGARWQQNNDGQFDNRLWEDEAYWQQSADFWRDLAARLKDNPAVALTTSSTSRRPSAAPGRRRTQRRARWRASSTGIETIRGRHATCRHSMKW